ncbi:MAG: type II secretion system F family protein, partial [Desulfobacterales bacterium]|nr:type II secretion system F family protein [Desulfobacterales bacterium]
MAKFSYKGINETGEQVSGVIEADSVEAANLILSGRGHIPFKITRQRQDSSTGFLESIKGKLAPVTAQELILFSKQFRTLLHAGVSVVRTLEVLENQTENPKLKTITAAMATDIKEGSTLYDAFRRHPAAFSPLYCSMLQAGEASGALPDILERLTYIIEHDHKVRSDIKSALQYPLIVVVFLGIAFLVLLTFVIPKFVAIFLAAGLELPLPTRMCMIMYDVLTKYWYLLLGGAVAGSVSLKYYFSTETGRFVLDSTLLKLPIFGPLFTKAAMA